MDLNASQCSDINNKKKAEETAEFLVQTLGVKADELQRRGRKSASAKVRRVAHFFVCGDACESGDELEWPWTEVDARFRRLRKLQFKLNKVEAKSVTKTERFLRWRRLQKPKKLRTKRTKKRGSKKISLFQSKTNVEEVIERDPRVRHPLYKNK